MSSLTPKTSHPETVSPVRPESISDAPKIPPPPWHRDASRPPRRSVSMIKRLWQPDEDPFFAAFKECTKSTTTVSKNVDNGSSNNNKGTKVMSLMKRSKLVFSCKNGCEIQEESLVRFPHLPPIPRERLAHRFKTSKVSPP